MPIPKPKVEADWRLDQAQHVTPLSFQGRQVRERPADPLSLTRRASTLCEFFVYILWVSGGSAAQVEAKTRASNGQYAGRRSVANS